MIRDIARAIWCLLFHKRHIIYFFRRGRMRSWCPRCLGPLPEDWKDSE